jgi:hypothetical protein
MAKIEIKSKEAKARAAMSGGKGKRKARAGTCSKRRPACARGGALAGSALLCLGQLRGWRLILGANHAPPFSAAPPLLPAALCPHCLSSALNSLGGCRSGARARSGRSWPTPCCSTRSCTTAWSRRSPRCVAGLGGPMRGRQACAGAACIRRQARTPPLGLDHRAAHTRRGGGDYPCHNAAGSMQGIPMWQSALHAP